MELNLGERFGLASILPAEGNITTLRIIRTLQMDLALTEEENKEFKVVRSPMFNGIINVAWDEEAGKRTKDVKIGEIATSIIVGQLKLLNEKNQLKYELIDLYEKFVEKPKTT